MTEAACCTNVMNSRIRALVKAIHHTPTQSVLYLSGGASQAAAWSLSVPGAGSTVLETVLPYSQMSMIQLLGKIPDKFCSQHTAKKMALFATEVYETEREKIWLQVILYSRLKKKYHTNAEKGENGEGPVFSKAHESKSFDLLKKIWGAEANGGDDSAKNSRKKPRKNAKANNNNNNSSTVCLFRMMGLRGMWRRK